MLSSLGGFIDRGASRPLASPDPASGRSQTVLARADPLSAAKAVFRPCPWPVEIDHTLGRKIAAGWGIAMSCFSASANRRTVPMAPSSGSLDRFQAIPTSAFQMAGSATRLGQGPDFWGHERQRYSPVHTNDAGLALNQLGKWGWAIGDEADFQKHPRLRPISFRALSR